MSNNHMHGQQRRKNSLAPIEDPKPPANKNEMTEESSIDDYLEAELNDKKIEFSERDRESIASEILSLTEEVETLKNENSVLRAKIQELESKSMEKLIPDDNVMCDTAELSKKINDLDFENDELILKNSELEFEIAKLREINTNLQSKVDSFGSRQNSEPTVRMPQNTNGISRNMFNNGYKTWR